MLTLSARLQLELRNRDPSEITELILDNSKANEIEGLDESYSNLRELSLVNVGLTTLNGFPSLISLEKLDLSDNKISSGLESLTMCSNLNQLLLTNNRIKSLKDLECLSNMLQLEVLDLFNCAVSFGENYRKDVFSLIPTLKYLDGFDEKNEEELNESDEDYDEEDEEREPNTEQKQIYELSENTESEEEYESEEGEIVHSTTEATVQSKTGGKDMNMFNNDVVELSDEEDDDEDEEDEDEYELDEEEGLCDGDEVATGDYNKDRPINNIKHTGKDGSNNDENDESNIYDEDVEEEEDEDSFDDIIETNGKIKNINDIDNYLSDSDEEEHLTDDDEDEEDDHEHDVEDDDDDNNNNNANEVDVNGIDVNNRKRTYNSVFDTFDENDSLTNDLLNATATSASTDINNKYKDDTINITDEDSNAIFDENYSGGKKMKHYTSNDITDLLDDPASSV